MRTRAEIEAEIARLQNLQAIVEAQADQVRLALDREDVKAAKLLLKTTIPELPSVVTQAEVYLKGRIEALIWALEPKSF